MMKIGKTKKKYYFKDRIKDQGNGIKYLKKVR